LHPVECLARLPRLPRNGRGQCRSQQGDTIADPRNIAHDKKVPDEKKHHGEEVAEGATETPQSGKKPKLEEDTGKPDTFQQHSRHHQPDDTTK